MVLVSGIGVGTGAQEEGHHLAVVASVGGVVGGVHERCDALGVSDVHGDPPLQNGGAGRRVPLLCGPVECPGAYGVGHERVGSQLEQGPDSLPLAVLNGVDQRREAVLVAHVQGGAAAVEEAAAPLAPPTRSVHQSVRTKIVLELQVGPRAHHQRGRSLDVALVDRVHQRGPAL